jgi:hypothetical protein
MPDKERRLRGGERELPQIAGLIGGRDFERHAARQDWRVVARKPDVGGAEFQAVDDIVQRAEALQSHGRDRAVFWQGLEAAAGAEGGAALRQDVEVARGAGGVLVERMVDPAVIFLGPFAADERSFG